MSLWSLLSLLSLLSPFKLSLQPYFLSEWCSSGADMKKPPMGSTLTYVPLVVLIEAPLMRHYHKKYHKK